MGREKCGFFPRVEDIPLSRLQKNNQATFDNENGNKLVVHIKD